MLWPEGRKVLKSIYAPPPPAGAALGFEAGGGGGGGGGMRGYHFVKSLGDLGACAPRIFCALRSCNLSKEMCIQCI